MDKWCPLCGHELLEEHGVRIDEESGFVTLDGKEIKTSRRLRQVLGILIKNSPRVVSRAFIMDEVYGLLTDKEEPSEKIIDIFVCKVRRAIKDSNYEIVTIWGKGWLFRKKVLHNGREENQQSIS